MARDDKSVQDCLKWYLKTSYQLQATLENLDCGQTYKKIT